jgi:hypothetical protein
VHRDRFAHGSLSTQKVAVYLERVRDITRAYRQREGGIAANLQRMPRQPLLLVGL